MGAKGTHTEHGRERDADLLRAYREVLAEVHPPFHTEDVLRLAVLRPASRFWVSYERALWQVSRLSRGMSLKDVSGTLYTEMYREIYRRVCAIRRERPGTDMGDAVLEVIYSPAPRFYVTPKSAKIMICRAKKYSRLRR